MGGGCGEGTDHASDAGGIVDGQCGFVARGAGLPWGRAGDCGVTADEEVAVRSVGCGPADIWIVVVVGEESETCRRGAPTKSFGRGRREGGGEEREEGTQKKGSVHDG